MGETYSSPKSNNGSDVKRNRLLVAALLTALGALACVALLMVNLMGYGVYFYTHTGNKDVILGAGIGVMHFAVGKPFEQWDSTPTYTPTSMQCHCQSQLPYWKLVHLNCSLSRVPIQFNPHVST